MSRRKRKSTQAEESRQVDPSYAWKPFRKVPGKAIWTRCPRPVEFVTMVANGRTRSGSATYMKFRAGDAWELYRASEVVGFIRGLPISAVGPALRRKGFCFRWEPKLVLG